MDSMRKTAFVSLTLNTVFSAYHLTLGIWSRSWWLITLGAYYLVLSIIRFYTLQTKRQKTSMVRFVGVLLLILSLPLAGTVILAVVKDRGQKLHEILMIAMAVYAFAKITIATINLIKTRKYNAPKQLILRNLSFADAFVSIFALQRSMLVSFGQMKDKHIMLFNILTGTAVWLIVILLGINLIGGKRITMAKSKIVTANKKIAETVTDGYKKIESGVVSGYKKIKLGVVGGNTKIEDKFVDAYLTKDARPLKKRKQKSKSE